MTEPLLPTPPSDPTPLPAGKPPLDPGMFPSRHRPLRQFLLDHNPCFLLSTVLMLLGCYLIRSAMSAEGDQFKMLLLLGTVNLYEACIIPIGLLLVRRTRGTARDGLWLVLFESLFLVNGTFLNVDPALLWGWSLNIALLLAALAKAWVLFRGLGIAITPRTWGFLALQLAIIYGLPIFFWHVSVDGRVPAQVMVATWWVVGMLPVLYDLLARIDTRGVSSNLVETVIRRVYLVAPWVMLLIHLRLDHWAHHCDFNLAYVAPVLLGLMIAAFRVKAAEVRAMALLLPVAAFFFTAAGTREMEWVLPTGGALKTISPMLLTFIGAVLAYAYLVSLWAAAGAAVILMGIALAWVLQDLLIEIVRRCFLTLRAICRATGSLLPTTAEGWGVLAVITAFVLLGAGAYTSLRRRQSTAHVGS